MSTETVRRRQRLERPALPDGRLPLQEPPVLPEQSPPDFSSMLMMLPMGIGGVLMAMSFSGVAGSSPMTYLLGGGMGVSMVAMSLGQLVRSSSERKRKLVLERRDFLRYISQLRGRAQRSADEQRRALAWDNPEPRALWSYAVGPRLWERRVHHDDFATVRIGVGTRPASVQLDPPTTKPVESLEPLAAISLRRFVEAYRRVPNLPTVVPLRSYTSIELTGELPAALDLARAVVGQLVTFHGPDELRVAVLAGADVLPDWDWVKWLPHNQNPEQPGVSGDRRLISSDHDALMDLLGADVLDRSEHDPALAPAPGEPLVVVVVDRAAVPETSRLRGDGVRNLVMIDITGMLPGGPRVLRLTTEDGQVRIPTADRVEHAVADRLDAAEAEELARLLAPKRTSSVVDLADQPLDTDFGLTALLGVSDARRFDVQALWRGRDAQRSRLIVPLGVSEQGEVVELDLKESAQGGMGPHGLLIGATGSGKSELLRTLVLGLAATHSSEVLNMVLVDFKGGATFLNMDRLPHTSAVITNLADELPLVDRMQDALNGEMNRRQEVLRRSGYPSLFEYERARTSGKQLSPMPTLLVIVDEFSELLASKPQFMDLFVSIGRLGRSLGVHLLLASQRLDEGRINRVEGHLSYRIALRTFSSMESRAVIGAAGAYELPNEPGHGYLKVDTTTLIRFKAAYVSGPAPDGASDGIVDEAPMTEVLPFYTHDRPDLHLPPPTPAVPVVPDLPAAASTPEAPVPDDESQTLADVFVGRLTAAGPAARQVWLPPLSLPSALDTLLPGVGPDPVRGMGVQDPAHQGRLRVPVGMVDRPYEQVRELLVADLSGAAGHVAVVGAPQSGKSTLVRSLLLALALTHTPAETQFYGMDFGGAGLASISVLPHFGSVATRLERDRVVRTVEELLQLIERRESVFTELGLESMAAYRQLRRDGTVTDDPFGDVFLVIDGWYTVKNDYPDLETKIGEIASRGLSFGVHLLVTATRWSEIRPWLRDLLTTRFELRLGDSMESEVGSRKAARVPERPGHGLTSAGLPFLAALPRLDGVTDVADLTAACRSAAEEIQLFWPGDRAPVVRMLPTRLPASALPAQEPGAWRVCLGQDEQRLAPVWHDFDTSAHLLVFGDDETGKTNVLRQVLRSIVHNHPAADARIVLGDYSRHLEAEVPEAYRTGYAVDEESVRQIARQAVGSLSPRVPDQNITASRLAKRDWWEGPRLFVVLDDYQFLTGSGMSPLEPLVPLLAQGVHIGLHVIVARSTSGAMRAMMDPAVRRLWELGSPGVVFGYPKEEGKFLGEAVPSKLPVGRAQLVTRRGVRLIQTALVPPVGADDGPAPRMELQVGR